MPAAKAVVKRGAARKRTKAGLIPRDVDDAETVVEGKVVRLTNLRKLFWPELGITKGDLLRFYAEISDVLLPHLVDRAMVMKRYPGGAHGEFFFQKRAPTPRPSGSRCARFRTAAGTLSTFPSCAIWPRCCGS